MPSYADAARLFAANKNVPLQHEVANVLEADTAFVQLAAILSGDAVEHAGGIEGTHHFARPLLAFQQPLQQHGVTLVRIDEAAVFGHCTDAIGVTVGRQSSLATLTQHGFLQHGDVRLNGLGIDTGKQRVQLAANLDMVDATLAENALENASSGTVHHVDSKLEAGLANQLEIDEVLDGGDVWRFEVSDRHASAGALQTRRIQFALDGLHD